MAVAAIRPHQRAVLRRLFQKLHKLGSYSRPSWSPRAATIYDEVLKTGLTPIPSLDLDQRIKAPGAMSTTGSKLQLFLDPTRNGEVLPVLGIHTSADWAHYRLYVLMFLIHENELRCLAFRFETDEGEPGDPPGDHTFCHAQMITQLNTMQLPVPPWLPTDQPSIPLWADDQITTTLCALVSLYGAGYVRRRLSTVSGLQDYAKRVRGLT